MFAITTTYSGCRHYTYPARFQSTEMAMVAAKSMARGNAFTFGVTLDGREFIPNGLDITLKPLGSVGFSVYSKVMRHESAINPDGLIKLLSDMISEYNELREAGEL